MPRGVAAAFLCVFHEGRPRCSRATCDTYAYAFPLLSAGTVRISGVPFARSQSLDRPLVRAVCRAKDESNIVQQHGPPIRVLYGAYALYVGAKDEPNIVPNRGPPIRVLYAG